MSDRDPRPPELWEALLPIGLAMAILSGGIIGLRDQAPVPVLLALACVTPCVLAARLGLSWAEIEEGLVHGMGLALKAVMILLVVGATIGTWAASGSVAAMIHYGLDVLAPSWFLPAACVLCAVVSLATGSSWSTAATVGVALMGMAPALGVSPAMTAGAVISGAYFGDKMSPLSDTTNLAPGIAGSGLFEHIHAMLFTTLPALAVALLLYAVLGPASTAGAAGSATSVQALQDSLRAAQHISPWLLTPPILVIGLALLRVPALPALLLAAASGGLAAWLAQGAGLGAIMQVIYSGYRSTTGVSEIDSLLSRGGMASMLDTIALVLCATAFGGIMERAGFIAVILERLLRRIQTARSLVAATLLSSLGTNFVLADQYLSIVLPGRMYRDAYGRFGLAPRLLSRTLEDGGTVTSALCPWNSGGAFMATTLGVATLSYAPYAFMNLLCPIIALATVWMGWFMWTKPADTPGPAPSSGP